MRSSLEKLRWLLLGGVFVLAAVIAALFGLSSYRAGKVWQRILARNGVNIRRESDGLTWSQSKGGRTVFTIHAGRSVPHGNGQWTLENAVLILYGKNGRDDRISGSQFEYDERAGELRAVGEVHLDLQAPTSAPRNGDPVLTFRPDDATAADPALIHVRTSGLVYQRKSEIASTDEPTEFRYKGLMCTSRGAAFDSAHNSLRLPADVRLQGSLRDAPFTLTAAEVVLDRQQETIAFQHPAVVSGDRAAQAQEALLHLHPNGDVEDGRASGGVEIRSGTETVRAPEAHATFGEASRPREVEMRGKVELTDADPARPLQGVTQTLELRLSEAGELQRATGQGAVRLVSQQASTGGPVRELSADLAEASFIPDASRRQSAQLQTLRLTGHAGFSGTSAPAPARPATVTRVNGDVLIVGFQTGTGGAQTPQHLAGYGHTRLEQEGDAGARSLSTGDQLDASFAARTGDRAGSVVLSQAVQTGDVVVQTVPATKPGEAAAVSSTGRGDKAVYLAADGTLTLHGAPARPAEVANAQTTMRAPAIVLHQGTGNAEASGGVVATAEGAEATHVLADHASLLRAPQLMEFYGTPAHPAQLWQDASQVQAAKLLLDGARHSLSARPDAGDDVVQAVFAAAEARPGLKARTATLQGGASFVPRGMPAAARDAVMVRAASMDFSDAQHEAVFRGGVEMRGPEGEVTGDHGAAFLGAHTGGAPEPKAAGPGTAAPGLAGLGGQLQRVVLLGDVHLRQTGRTGTGAQLTYTTATAAYVLTGVPSAPPRIDDSQQGTVTGTTLTFGGGDSSIVVAGAPPGGGRSRAARVHTETDLKPQ